MKFINVHICSSLTQYQVNILDHTAYLCASPPLKILLYFVIEIRLPKLFIITLNIQKT